LKAFDPKTESTSDAGIAMHLAQYFLEKVSQLKVHLAQYSNSL